MGLPDPNAPWGWIPPDWETPPVESFAPPFATPQSEISTAPSTAAAAPSPFQLDIGPVSVAPASPFDLDIGPAVNLHSADALAAEHDTVSNPTANLGEFAAPADPVLNLRSPDALAAEHDTVSNPTVDLQEFTRGGEAPQPGFMPDAVTGGMVPGQELEGAHQTSGTPQMPEDYLDADELGQKYADLDPIAYEKLKVKQQLAREDELATRQLEESRKTRDQAEQNFQIEKSARERAAKDSGDVIAEAKKLAEVDITDDAWMESRSPLQKVAAFAAAILGGLGSGSTGGRNMGLEAIQNTINQHTANLRANLANKRTSLQTRQNAIENQYARDMDSAKGAEIHRQALYEQAIRGLEVEMQKFDPRGTTAVRISDGIRGLRGQQAQAQAAFEQQQFKNSLDLSKHTLEEEKHLLEVAKARPDIALKMKKLQGGGAAAVLSPDFLQGKYGKRPPMAMSEKDYSNWLGTLGKIKTLDKGPGGDKSEAQMRKEVADATKAEAEAEAAASGYAIKNPETGEIITNPDGKAVVEMDATKRNRASSIIEAAANVRRLADRMAALKKNSGGAIRALGSTEAQELQQLVSQIDFETFKAFDLGAPSEGDKALAEGVRGGVDPTSFVKDATAGFQAYADAVEKKANTALRNSGYKGTGLKFHRASDVKKAAPTLTDEATSRLARADDYAPPYDPAKPWIVPNVREMFASKKSEEDFTVLAAYADQPGDKGDLARKQLKDLADGAVSPAVRAKAKKLLDAIPGTHVRGDGAR
jgi:hypothetical protein